MKASLILVVISIILLSCSKEDNIEPNPTNAPRTVCHPKPTYIFTANDEMNGYLPADTILLGWFSIHYPHIITPNNDGYNDQFTFGLIPSFLPDSSILIVKDNCGNLFYDSGINWNGPINPPRPHVGWSGFYLPDSASWHNIPYAESPEGRYNYEFTIWMLGSSNPMKLNGVVELTRP